MLTVEFLAKMRSGLRKSMLFAWIAVFAFSGLHVGSVHAASSVMKGAYGVRASSHAQLTCSVSASDTETHYRPYSYTSLAVGIKCDDGLLGSHHELSATTNPIVSRASDGLFHGVMDFTLKDNGLLPAGTKRHSEQRCRGEIQYDNSTGWSRIWTHFLCRAGMWSYHPWFYCNPALYEPIGTQLAPINARCRMITQASKRSWKWWDIGPDNDLIVDAVGRKDGTLVVRVFSPDIVAIIVRQDSKDLRSFVDKTVPVVNGIATYKSNRKGLHYGLILLLGNGSSVAERTKYTFGFTDAGWITAISPTIWWGQ